MTRHLSRLRVADILCGAAAIAPALGIVAPKAFVILLPLAAAAAAFAARRTLASARPRVAVAAAAALLLAWGAASAFWALQPHLVWPTWFQILLYAGAGASLLSLAHTLAPSERRRVGLATVWGLCIGLALLSLEIASRHFMDPPLGRYLWPDRDAYYASFNRGAVVVVLLAWPAAAFLLARRRWTGAAGLLLAAAAVLSQFESMAALLGLAGGGIAFLVALRRPRLAAGGLAAAVVVVTALMPLLPRTEIAQQWSQRRDISVSIYHRLSIWAFVADRIAERPVLGWGLNSSRDIPGGIDAPFGDERRLPLHPHNAVLQWWLELGAIGAAIGAGVVLVAIRGAASGAPAMDGGNGPRAAALGMVTAAFLVSLVGYGFWQGWWMAALWLSAGVIAAIGFKTDPIADA